MILTSSTGIVRGVSWMGCRARTRLICVQSLQSSSRHVAFHPNCLVINCIALDQGTKVEIYVFLNTNMLQTGTDEYEYFTYVAPLEEIPQ